MSTSGTVLFVLLYCENTTFTSTIILNSKANICGMQFLKLIGLESLSFLFYFPGMTKGLQSNLDISNRAAIVK